jgi:hypothetical protein
MALCILCDSEATITETTAGNLVNCSVCCVYTLAETLLDELPKESDWYSLRGKLSGAVRWRFYKEDPVTLLNVLSARWLIEAWNDERDRKEPQPLLPSSAPVQSRNHCANRSYNWEKGSACRRRKRLLMP